MQHKALVELLQQKDTQLSPPSHSQGLKQLHTLSKLSFFQIVTFMSSFPSGYIKLSSVKQDFSPKIHTNSVIK